jgi:hypothetical protein
VPLLPLVGDSDATDGCAEEVIVLLPPLLLPPLHPESESAANGASKPSAARPKRPEARRSIVMYKTP